MREEIKSSILTVERPGKLTMSGVSSVDAFSESQIVLTVGGRKVRIEGKGLKVLAFSEGSGNFVAGGEVLSVRFHAERGGLKKLFR